MKNLVISKQNEEKWNWNTGNKEFNLSNRNIVEISNRLGKVEERMSELADKSLQFPSQIKKTKKGKIRTTKNSAQGLWDGTIHQSHPNSHKIFKHLGNNWTKAVKDLGNEKPNTLKEDRPHIKTTKKNHPYLFTDRFNVIKMSLLPKSIYNYNTIPIEIHKIVHSSLEQKLC